MRRSIAIPLLMLALRTASPGAEPSTAKERFDIRGMVDVAGTPDGRRYGRSAGLRLSSTNSPYAASAQSDPLTGEFRFRKVPEGVYTLDAFGRAGAARYGVIVNRQTAGDSKTIRIQVRLQIRSGELKSHLKRRFEVSYRTLSIPDKAFREYEAAEKRIQKEDYPGAIERLERAVALAPQYTAAWNRLGLIAFYDKRLPDAERYFRSAADKNPDAWDSRLRLGQVLMMQGKAAEAIPVTEAAVRLRPNDPAAHTQLAMTWVELKDYEKAVQYLLEAKRLDPRHYTEPQLWLARIYVAQKKYPAAVREVEEYVSAHPRGRDTEALRKWLRDIRSGGTRE